MKLTSEKEPGLNFRLELEEIKQEIKNYWMLAFQAYIAPTLAGYIVLPRIEMVKFIVALTFSI